ncbi:MAG: LCP family protein [Clostridia bacterium]|nr:LCP family protein [Clostridia bacterium]
MDNLRRFLVVFCIMLVLAAAVCGVRLVRSYDNSNKDLIKDLDIEVPTYDPSGSSVQSGFKNNILFICYDPDISETQMMFIANVDSLAKSVDFLLLPKEMKFNIATGSLVGDFGSMYFGFSGSAGASCASAMASFFDIDINYYFCITTEEMGKLLGSFCSEDGGIVFDVPVDIYYRDFEKNIHIDVKRGSHIFTGNDAVNFLRFYKTYDGTYTKEMLQYYDGTDSKRMNIVARFIDAFITQKFFEPSTDFYIRRFPDLVTPFLSKADTNLNESVLGVIGQIMGASNSQKIGYFIPLGDVSFNDRMYLEYNGYIRNLELDENISPSVASDILSSRFKTVY